MSDGYEYEYARESETERVVFRAKLPDNLAFSEYNDLIFAIETLLAAVADSGGQYPSSGPSVGIVKAQYGSEFIVVLAVGVTIAGGLVSIGKFLESIANAAQKIQEAGKTREERLSLKHQRTEREEMRSARITAQELSTVSQVGHDPLVARAASGDENLLRAVVRLGRYRFSLTMEGKPRAR